MHYTSIYQSPVGEILLAADEAGVVGIWFKGEKYLALRASLWARNADFPCN